MKRILKGEDVEFKIELLDEENELINYNLFSVCKFTAYTTDVKTGVVYNRVDYVDYVLHLSSQDLAKLKNGSLKIDYEFGIPDSSYPDGVFNKKGTLTTRYILYLGDSNNETNGWTCKCDC